MVFDFKIGTPVFSGEGEIGRLRYLVVDPNDESISSLIIKQGRLLHKDIVVPVSWVEKADEKGVVLDAYLPELETLPEFREVEYRTLDPSARPFAGHQPHDVLVWVGPYPYDVPIVERPEIAHRGRLGVTEDEVVVRRGQPVYASDGHRVATLDHVLVDKDNYRIRHLVVHRGQWLQRGDDLVIPADAVSYITDGEIRLNLNRNELGQLATYRPPMGDTQLEEIITKGLQTQPETKGQDVKVQVDRGLVRLFGDVPESIAAAATSIAKRIQGVIGVEDHTARAKKTGQPDGAHTGSTNANDAALTSQLADALQRQGQEDLSNVRVQVNKGVAHLSGTTPTVAGKALAEQVAKAVPGVASVQNDLTADAIIRARVEAALAEDRRTSLASIDVICRAGIVTLLGQVPTAEVKEAAEQIARSTPGVIQVVSELVVCPVEDDIASGKLVAMRMGTG